MIASKISLGELPEKKKSPLSLIHISKGFTYTSVYFDSTEEMAKALQNGTVDAMVTSSLYRTNNERILEKFGSSDFYVIVKKGNTELLDQVNYAIDQMNAAEGNWKTTLYSKNYERADAKNLEYTEEEKSIIAQYSKDLSLIHSLCGTASALPKCSIIHKVLLSILATQMPHLARRIGT